MSPPASVPAHPATAADSDRSAITTGRSDSLDSDHHRPAADRVGADAPGSVPAAPIGRAEPLPGDSSDARRAAPRPRTLRTFVAVELPADARRLIARAQGLVRATLGSAADAVRWVDPAGAHLTLKFLGQTPESAVGDIEDALRRAMRAELGPAAGGFRLESSGLGCFPTNRAPRVLWLGLAGDLAALGALRDAVEAALAPLGWPTEARPFSPHLTLGRVRPEATPAERVGIGRGLGTIWPPRALAIDVRTISLMLSETRPDGPRYTRLAEVALDG